MTWRNRIVGAGTERPEDLLANPKNWRIHPLSQQSALLAVLRKVGIVQRVTVNRRTGFVLDGHLRVALAISEGVEEVPVEYVDLAEEEEALVLATLDPISKMAGTDKDQLEYLLAAAEEVTEAEDIDLTALLGHVRSENGVGGEHTIPGGGDPAHIDRDGTRELRLALRQYQYDWVKQHLANTRKFKNVETDAEALLEIMSEYLEEEVPQ